MLVRDPERFDVHAIQKLRQALAGWRDLTTARAVRARGNIPR
jgi:hypothetical protein